MSKEFGVLYIATGKKYIEEAYRSACSVREVMPDMEIALFTDNTSLVSQGVFDYVNVIENPTNSSFDKILQLCETPFQKTLFLDTDTLIIEPFHELSGLLDRFDLACCHAPWRYGKYDITECTSAFPELNTGVILYKKVEPVLDLYRVWSETYRRQKERKLVPEGSRIPDQPSFRKALYESSLKFFVLTPEYNLRISAYMAGGNAKVKILHGRGPFLRELRSIINSDLKPRVGYSYGFIKTVIRKMKWRIVELKKSIIKKDE